jgi:hypothetical protein
MDQTILPFDIQYRILAEISELDLSENAQANWGRILNYFCISRESSQHFDATKKKKKKRKKKKREMKDMN